MRIAIVGAGIAGVTAAHALAGDGHHVTVYERRGSVAAEASYAQLGLVAPSLAGPGLLSPFASIATRDWWSKSAAFRTDGDRRNRGIVSELECVADNLGLTINQLATAWMLSVPGVHVAIVGARRVGQLQDSVAACEAVLTEADVAAIEDIRSFAPIV